MRLLILGGTAWLGSTLAAEGVRRGHSVTCLARGESGEVPAGAELVHADRTQPGAYDRVRDREWDAVVDVTRQPGQARAAAEALADRAIHAVLVSSGNAYADTDVVGTDESAPLLPPLDGDVMETMETYGEAKVACEQAYLGGFGEDRVLVARVGLIGGPGDQSGRSGYWPKRFAEPAASDGTVVVPDAVDLAAQVIDVRDLAAWLLDAAESRVAGVFNATGATTTFPEFIDVARRVAGHGGPVLRVPPEWLEEQGVEPWMGERSLPMWLPMPSYAGFVSRSSAKAREAGLVTRPLADTLRDVLAWEAAQPGPWDRRAGLPEADERDLIRTWRSSADVARRVTG